MNKYIVVLYEKCHKTYTTLTEPLLYEQALDFWKKKTNNGKRSSKKEHGDYFKIMKMDDGFIITKYNG